jgi:Sugar kinases, ribokinase family
MPYIEKSDLVKLNEEELLIVTQNESISESINFLSKEYDATFILTLGKNGSIVFNKDYEMNFEAKKVKAVDTTGAGDAYIGSFLYKISQHENKKEILMDKDEIKNIAYFATNIAGEICKKYGALTALNDL